MKSSRQRRLEIKAPTTPRSRAAKRLRQQPRQIHPLPKGALAADPTRLLHDNTYDAQPAFYVDRRFSCIDCGTSQIWTAGQQKWWYEEAKGKIASTAIRCRQCRLKRRMRHSQERRLHVEGLVDRFGVEGAAARLKIDVDTLHHMRSRWLEA
ncbi:MAG: zinc-ribbon domain-containing protein [Hyphomicrobiaceae bacterium]